MIKLVNLLNYDIISCRSFGEIFTGVTTTFSLKLFVKILFLDKFEVERYLISKNTADKIYKIKYFI